MQNVSIIIITHEKDPIMKEGLRRINSQKFSGKKEIIIVNREKGLAENINYGIKKSKYPIIITVPKDCVPENEYWLEKLIEPFQDKKVVASASKVLLPKEIWEKFDYFGKILSAKEQKKITTLLDEKGCAYKKSALENIGLFDENTFRTAGEDFDMYIKLKKEGKIAHPDTTILHYHSHPFKKRLIKEHLFAEGAGCLLRKYKRELPDWWKFLIKAIPIFGLPAYWINFPYKKMPIKGLIWIFLLSFVVHIEYLDGFYKGFLRGKQII